MHEKNFDGARISVDGARKLSMVHGFLWMVHENFRWCTDFGPMVHEKFWMVHGFRQMVQGFRSMVHGFRPMVHGYPCTGAQILTTLQDKGGDRGRIIRNFRKMLHFGKIPKKFGQNLVNIQQNSDKICAIFVKNQQHFTNS